MKAITGSYAVTTVAPKSAHEVQLRAAGDTELKHAPVIRLKTHQEGRSVAIRYWIVRDAAQRTQDAARVIQPIPWAKAYIGARDIIKFIQTDDQNLSCDFTTAVFLFVPEEAGESLDSLPEVQASDIFSLQTGITLFSLQVIPIAAACHAPTICRSFFQLSLEHKTSSNFIFSQLRVSKGCLRYWDPELQGYSMISEGSTIPPVTGQFLQLLLELKVTGAASGPDYTPTKQPPRESYASIFSRQVDHYQLAAVPHVATEHPDWQAASRALQLGFLNAKSGHTDKALRALLWNGVPHRYRRGFWLAMSGGLATIRANPRSYDAALAKVLAHKDRYTADQAATSQQLSPDMAKVPLFGADWDPHTETLKSVAYSILNREGQRQMKVVLCVLQETHPSLFHAPSLPILLCLLLLFLSAEEAYATLACLLHISSLGGLPWFFRCLRTENDFLLSWFDGLFATRHPALHEHFKNLQVHTVTLITPWLENFFSHHLPLHAVLQLVDVFLMDGAPVLYKLALAIFALLEPELLTCTTSKAVDDLIEDRLPHLPVPELFLKAFRTPLSRKEIPFADKELAFDQRRTENIPVLYDPNRAEGNGDLCAGKKHFLNPLKARKESSSVAVNPLSPLPAIGSGSFATPEEVYEPGLILYDTGQRKTLQINGSRIEEVDDLVRIEQLEELDCEDDVLNQHPNPNARFLEWKPANGVSSVAPRGRSGSKTTIRRTRSLGPADPSEISSIAVPPDISQVNALLELTPAMAAPDDWRLDLPASSPYLYGTHRPGDSPTAGVPPRLMNSSHSEMRFPSSGSSPPKSPSPKSPPPFGSLRHQRSSTTIHDPPDSIITSPLDRDASHPKSLLRTYSDSLVTATSPHSAAAVARIQASPLLALEGPEAHNGSLEFRQSPLKAELPSAVSPGTVLQMRRSSIKRLT